MDDGTVNWWLAQDDKWKDLSCSVGFSTASGVYPSIDRATYDRLCKGETPTTVPVSGEPLTADELNTLAGPAAAWMSKPSPSTYDALAAQAKTLVDLARPVPPSDGRSSQDNEAALRRLVSYPGSDQAVAVVLGDLRTLIPAIPFILKSGSFRIGAEVPPGTYRTTKTALENCYWETLDEEGRITDNNFVSAAPQVIMRIRPGDFAVNVDSECGVWVRIG